jgi:hypothetical protein
MRVPWFDTVALGALVILVAALPVFFFLVRRRACASGRGGRWRHAAFFLGLIGAPLVFLLLVRSERLKGETRVKTIVMFATVHQYQKLGNARSSELERRLDYLKSQFGVQIVMEEWAENQGESVAKAFANKLGLHWANVGTPEEPQYRTYTGPINFPGHDGTLTDWDAPGMDEYGPFDNQEARENRMAQNIEVEMENYETGLFIVGLAHLHSIFGKLRPLGFKVTAFSWL